MPAQHREPRRRAIAQRPQSARLTFITPLLVALALILAACEAPAARPVNTGSTLAALRADVVASATVDAGTSEPPPTSAPTATPEPTATRPSSGAGGLVGQPTDDVTVATTGNSTPAAAGTFGRAPTEPPMAQVTEVEDAIFALANRQRVSRGLPALARNSHLDASARQYAASALSEEVRASGDLPYLMSNAWWQTYKGGEPWFDEHTAVEQVAYSMEEQRLRNTLLRPDATEIGIGVAIVGNTVYYVQVFDVLASLGGDGEPIALYDSPQAQDPSWEQLKEFLLADDTDANAYELGSFVCSDYAEMLHNRAEQAGIRAAYVSVGFQEGPGHALNAFMVDGALAFVDPTGGDAVAYVEPGRTYGVTSLDAATCFTYVCFEQYVERVSQLGQERDAYLTDAAAYDSEIEEYNAAVDAYDLEPTEDEYDRLTEWRQGLEQRAVELDSWGERLDAEYASLGEQWDTTSPFVDVPDPTVTSVYIHW